MRIAGVDIGGTTVKIGIFNEHGEMLTQYREPTVIGNPEAVAKQIGGYLQTHPVDYVGIGTPGTVDKAANHIKASNLGWVNTPFHDLMAKELQVPFWIDNDAQTALLAEHFNGACVGMRDVIMLTLGTGIGGAVLLNGHLWRGPQNIGCEFGHMILHPDGLPCKCGMKGCFERYASASALMARVPGLSGAQIIENAWNGDAVCRSALDDYEYELCYGIATLLRIFTPEAVVLGGGVSNAGQRFIDECMKKLQSICQTVLQRTPVHLLLARHSNEAGMLGAAVLAMRKQSKQ